MAYQYDRHSVDDTFGGAYQAIQYLHDKEERQCNYHAEKVNEATTGTAWVYSQFLS